MFNSHSIPKVQIDESIFSNHDIHSKQISFHLRNTYQTNLTLQDCDNILQIHGIQQTMSDQLQYFSGNMKITIKDKPISQTQYQNIQLMKKAFDALFIYASEKKRLRLLQEIVQKQIEKIYLKRYFHQWRQKVNCMKALSAKRKEEYKLEDLKKVELFVNVLNKQQQMLVQQNQNKYDGKNVLINVNKQNNNSIKKNLEKSTENDEEIEKDNSVNNQSLLFKNRLNMKKKIIADQRMKLAEQNRIIEEMKLKQIQAESKLAEMETLSVVDGAFGNCKERSRRILKQLVKNRAVEKSKYDMVSTKATVVKTPDFLIRMEARSAARREQIQRREEERRRKLGEQIKLEEAMKLNEERRRKRIEKEAKEETKRIMAEKKREKIVKLEQLNNKKELANNYYKKYLLRCGLRVFKQLVQLNEDLILKVTHFSNNLLIKRTFFIWKYESDHQINEKLYFYKNIYEKKLLGNILIQWHKITQNKLQKKRLIVNHYNFHLQKNYFNKWWMITLTMTTVNNIDYEKAVNFYNKKILMKYFKMCRKYLQILDKIKDSDNRINHMRQLVLAIVPDFAPEVRGVCEDE